MKLVAWTTAMVLAGMAGTALAGGADNPDFRIRAKINAPDNGQWGANESLGGGDFRVHSRFLQLYYGGVHRNDEFRFSVQLDFTGISGFATEFASSPYNVDYDIYINNEFVGRADTNNPDFGIAELSYKSRHPSPPDLPLPPNFPEPVGAGDTLRIFAAASTLPNIGDPLPAGEPMFTEVFGEEFARGDVNQDKKVNTLDFPSLALNYDPYHLLGPAIGPANGDFTGDNFADHADYALFVANWTDSKDPPAEPDPIITPSCPPDFNRDGFLTGDDFDGYVNAFESGDTAADFNVDGFVTGDDFDAFVLAFEAGC